MTTPVLLQGDARALPLPDESVDLVVTSPPYFGLRDYGYDGQLGGEPTPREFVDALIACTREMARVLKPSGSIFVNLGDKYAGGGMGGHSSGLVGTRPQGEGNTYRRVKSDVPSKSLMMIPERYRIACVDELGLIARAVIVWDKPNGLPESVTDRVRRSHEDWVHLTKSPRYYSAIDEIREQYSPNKPWGRRGAHEYIAGSGRRDSGVVARDSQWSATDENPLGKLPGSVWAIASQPLHVPADLDTDHFAAFPMEWPRRIVSGWCPRHVCTACGEGRRPVTTTSAEYQAERAKIRESGRVTEREAALGQTSRTNTAGLSKLSNNVIRPETTITGYACACPDTSAPSTPGTVLDPFSGTGTTALVATMLGRRGIGVDLSEDYQRIARWRCGDPKERARAAGLDPEQVARIRPADPTQSSLFDEATA